MNGLILALFVSTGGIETTWERTADGETVYVVQLDDQAIAALKRGYPITSAIPSELKNVKSIRLQYGTTPLLKPALPEPQNLTSTPTSAPNQWTANPPGSISLASAPQSPSPNGTLSPAEAFERNQSENEIRYPDRRRPLEPTVLGGTSDGGASASIAGQGTFSGANVPFGSSTQPPPRTPNNGGARPRYDGESLLSNGQVNPLTGQPSSQNYGGSPMMPGPAGQGSPNGGSFNPGSSNSGAFNPNTFAGGGGVPNQGGQIRVPTGASQNNTGSAAGQWTGTGWQSYPAAPPLISGPTLSPPGNAANPPWILPSGETARPPAGAQPNYNQAQNPYPYGQDPRVAAGGNPYSIQPIPASNQPANAIPARPGANYSGALPTQLTRDRGSSTSSNSWWQLVNHQNADAGRDGGRRLADSLKQRTVSNTGSPSPASDMMNRLAEGELSSESSEKQPSGDSGVATLGLLFLSIGLNIYMGYMLRGFYIKTRQLARDLRETIATV